MIKTHVRSMYEEDHIWYQKRFKPTQDINWQDIVYLDPCSYCQEYPDTPSREHVIPHADGGSQRWDNIVGACSICNRRRDRMKVVLAIVNPPPKLRARWKEMGSPFITKEG